MIDRDERVGTEDGWRFACRREDTPNISGGRVAELIARSLAG